MRIRRIVDLSVPVGPGTQVYPGGQVPRLQIHSTIARHGFNLLRLDMGSHTGRIDFADPLVSCLPIALQDADGTPVRAVAMDLEA